MLNYRRFSVANSSYAKTLQETSLQGEVDWLALTAVIYTHRIGIVKLDSGGGF